MRSILAAAFLCLAITGNGWSAQLLEPDQLGQWRTEGRGFLLVDTREALHFDRKHIEGALNIPYFVIASKPLPSDRPIVLYGRGMGSMEAERAYEKLAMAGYGNHYILSGGLIRWEAKGHPVVAPTGIIEDGLAQGVMPKEMIRAREAGEEFILVDIRPAKDFADGHIRGAASRPYTRGSYEPASDIPKDAVVILYDLRTSEVMEAVEAYRRAGFGGVRYLNGGIIGWAMLGEPLEIK